MNPKPSIEARVFQLLNAAPQAVVAPTGIDRTVYLDLAERLVRVAARWQDPQGAIIDPVLKSEWGQSSPRFLSPGAVLLHFGRLDDLREQVYLAMDWCCGRLARGEAQSPDFWMREIMTAWTALKGQPVDAERRTRWESQLRSIDPEAIYWQVSRDGSRLRELHNWTVYAAAGEGLRQLADLGPRHEGSVVWGSKFFEKYIPPQLDHFSAQGMYRDPNDPFTYDMTTRLQLATPLALGLQSPLRPVLDDLLRRGALAQLLYVSPDGLAPFGGRSNQFHLQEAILAALGEMEANRYKSSHPQLAGAFKRQARLGVGTIRRWLEMQPHRHLKNGFGPKDLHGCEDYAGYAVYSLFTASCLALAALFADDSIAEARTPAESGSYVVELAPAFHKIFAVCGRTQIEIDTGADLHYDATGLGRFHQAGVPGELGLMGPLSARPSFKIPDVWKPAAPTAIGVCWMDTRGEWTSLAGLSEGLTSDLEVMEESEGAVEFQVHWDHVATQTSVRETYRLRPGQLRLTTEVTIQGQNAERTRLTVPLLEGDGAATSQIALKPGSARVTYRDATYSVTHAADAETSLGPVVANRNGLYRILSINGAGPSATVQLALQNV